MLRILLPAYAAVLVLVVLAGLGVAGGPTGVDTAVMNRVAGMRSGGLTDAVSVLSELFSPTLVPVWALLVAGLFLFLDRRVARAGTVLGSVVGAAAVAEVIKLVVGRPRPPAIDQIGAYETGFSYPSGHVTGTAALLLSTAVAGTVAHRRLVRALAVIAALAVTVVVAWTRLYLGAHWITDVTAGLVVGAATTAVVAPLVPPVLALVRDRAGDRIPPRLAEWISPAPAPATAAGSA